MEKKVTHTVRDETCRHPQRGIIEWPRALDSGSPVGAIVESVLCAILEILTLNGFSPVCVNMCRLMSNSLAKSLPHWGHGMGPELPCVRRCSRYGSSFITSIFYQFDSTVFLEDSESDRMRLVYFSARIIIIGKQIKIL